MMDVMPGMPPYIEEHHLAFHALRYSGLSSTDSSIMCRSKSDSILEPDGRSWMQHNNDVISD